MLLFHFKAPETLCFSISSIVQFPDFLRFNNACLPKQCPGWLIQPSSNCMFAFLSHSVWKRSNTQRCLAAMFFSSKNDFTALTCCHCGIGWSDLQEESERRRCFVLCSVLKVLLETATIAWPGRKPITPKTPKSFINEYWSSPGNRNIHLVEIRISEGIIVYVSERMLNICIIPLVWTALCSLGGTPHLHYQVHNTCIAHRFIWNRKTFMKDQSWEEVHVTGGSVTRCIILSCGYFDSRHLPEPLATYDGPFNCTES